MQINFNRAVFQTSTEAELCATNSVGYQDERKTGAFSSGSSFLEVTKANNPNPTKIMALTQVFSSEGG